LSEAPTRKRAKSPAKEGPRKNKCSQNIKKRGKEIEPANHPATGKGREMEETRIFLESAQGRRGAER